MTDHLESLNEQQRQAVMHWGAPLLILAGAGSGKTRVITSKIAYLIEEKSCDPQSILAVTFTNKAADEMRVRAAALAPKAERVMIKTFHSFGAWLLRRNAAFAGLAQSFRIYDDDDVCSLLRQILGRGTAHAELRRLASLISRAKDYCLPPNGDLTRISLNDDFREVYGRYQQRLRDIGNADFGDLIMRSVELLSGYPDIRQSVRRRFRVILVDEYQDSNLAQFRLLRELYDRENYVCVVGDEDQSIYGFRGAEIGNILGFHEHFAGTETIRLEENYRSTRTILQVASAVVQHNTKRLGKTLWTSREADDPVALVCLRDQEREARFCARLVEDGDFRGTAILYRMNSQSRTFEEVFSRAGIPYRVVGTTRFYDREEVKDVLGYMALLLNPRDLVSFRRVANKPPRGIGGKSLEKITAASGDVGGDLLAASNRSATELSGKAGRGARAFAGICEDLSETLETHSLHDFIRMLAERSGLLEHYRERDAAEGTQRVENLEELVNAGAGYPDGREGLAGFLEAVMLSSTDENPYEPEDRVTLITIHNTKGLEFDRVVISGLEDGVFPHRSSTLSEDELEEERRLFYVGITRARNSLFLTWCRERRVFGRWEYQRPSRFLREVPETAFQIYEDVD